MEAIEEESSCMGNVGPHHLAAKSDPMQLFMERCRELETQVLRAQHVDPEKASWLSAIWHYAIQQASCGNHDSANSALSRLHLLLGPILEPDKPSQREAR